jgi:hypothetical protein
MVKDMDKAIAFYQAIGLAIQNRWGNHYAMLTAPGITLGIHPSSTNDNSSGTVSIGFMVDDIGATKTLLSQNKIPFQEQDDEKSGIYLHFKDLDGTVLYFVKPKWG